MFEICRDDCESHRLRLQGRFDASCEQYAGEVFDQVEGDCTLDFEDLAYISSCGLGLLVALQLRLAKAGNNATLVNLNPHIRELLGLAGLDDFLQIE